MQFGHAEVVARAHGQALASGAAAVDLLGLLVRDPGLQLTALEHQLATVGARNASFSCRHVQSRFKSAEARRVVMECVVATVTIGPEHLVRVRRCTRRASHAEAGPLDRDRLPDGRRGSIAARVNDRHHLVAHRLLAAHAYLAQRAGPDADIRLATEQASALPRGTRVGVEAAFEDSGGRQAATQVFGDAYAPPAAGRGLVRSVTGELPDRLAAVDVVARRLVIDARVHDAIQGNGLSGCRAGNGTEHGESES
mmetsp:Transcript_53128/g.124276  ORF Transcript_53128/g.124276 Transcript_53128/m.124276 type:complete len:253 (-) Transcript_53128:4631-5389(-)